VVDAGISYRRDFIILEEESGTFRSDNQKTLTGYVKIEDRGIKAKVSIYIQNVNEGHYIAICICVRDGKVYGVKCGNIIALKQDKVDTTFETMSKNLFSSNYEINDVVGICIISAKKSKVLEGFKSQKYQYILNQIDNIEENEQKDYKKEYNLDDKSVTQKDSQYENEFKDKDESENENHDKVNILNIGNECEEKDNKENEQRDNKDNKNDYEAKQDNVYIKNDKEQEEKHEDERHEHDGRTRKEELKYIIFEADPHIEDRDDVFIPFQNANIKANWRKKHLNKIPDSYAKKVLLIPYIYNMASLYGHYIVGETDKYFIVGIPSRFNESNRYMARYGDIAEWVRMSNNLKNYGYWMFVINKEKGDIIYLE
jgi:hypothetical protein